MMTTNSLPLTLTKKTLAGQLNVSLRTLERMRAAGLIPEPLAGLKRPRWSTEAVMTWLGSASTAVPRAR